MESPGAFMQRYEVATNSHDVSELRPFIATNATYWFTDGSFAGISDIEAAIIRTFQTIQGEVYTLQNVEWIATSTDFAVCKYDFEWNGIVFGKRREGSGRGTSVIVKTDDQWQVLHEHLSDRVQ
ncbi:MAG: YybH family protein [Acidimicrobiales bacterium]